MTFLAILVWLLIVAGTAYMLKTLIFKQGLSSIKECCSMASGGSAGNPEKVTEELPSEVLPSEEAPQEEAGEAEKVPQGDEK